MEDYIKIKNNSDKTEEKGKGIRFYHETKEEGHNGCVEPGKIGYFRNDVINYDWFQEAIKKKQLIPLNENGKKIKLKFPTNLFDIKPLISLNNKLIIALLILTIIQSVLIILLYFKN